MILRHRYHRVYGAYGTRRTRDEGEIYQDDQIEHGYIISVNHPEEAA